jgi:hypothetical protein
MEVGRVFCVSTYKLSWEEFLEFNQNSLPSQSIASFVAMIFMAVAVGIFGVVLTYAVDPGSRLTASIFCWLSLVLFLAAFWDLRGRTARRKKRATGELRRAYEQFYSGERSFVCDEQKWTVETQGGRQESSWSSLLSAAEWPNVITLSARDQLSAAIPKRALTSEELQTLRRLAITPALRTWNSSVNLADFLLTELPSLWRRHPFLMTEAHAGGLWFFVMIANDMYHSVGLGTYVGWILAAMFLFLTLTAQFWYFLIKYLTSHKELRRMWQVGFSEKGVHIKTAKLDLFSSWANFRKAREATRCFLLYVNSSMYYTLPKHCLSADQRAAMRELLKTKLATT